MSVPKSVVKYKKGDITYTSSVDRASYFLFELSRAALRDVAKFVKRTFREYYYSEFNKRTGRAGRVTQAVVISSKNTQYPRVEIGLKKGRPKKSRNDGFYGYFQELGTSKTPKLGLLKKSVQENIAKIVDIESQYLSGLESEARALSMIDSEDDYEVDDDE